MLNDLWSPDVKANQLADVISGIEPIRSVVNVGSGVADLVLLPIKQYKKDGRIIRGLQKGTTSFVKSTAMEAIRLGARLANGTQIILEHRENVLGGAAGVGDPSTYAGAYEDGWTRAEVHGVVEDPWSDEEAHEDLLASGITPPERVSRYANQPRDVREGLQSAYVSLGRNLQSAAQTILAVPMEVYERSRTGSEVGCSILAFAPLLDRSPRQTIGFGHLVERCLNPDPKKSLLTHISFLTPSRLGACARRRSCGTDSCA